MTKQYTIAVIAAKTLVGESLLELLAERNFPISKIHALASAAFEDEEVEFGRRTLDIQAIEAFDFTSVELAFFIDAYLAEQYGEKAAESGCLVIDLSGHFSGKAGVPLIIPEVNPNSIIEYKNHNIVASPLSTTVQLLLALKPIHDVARITRINMTTYQAVSGSGRGGIDELASQTAQLLNGRPIDTKLYPKQIAFNVLPQINSLQENGYTVDENRLVREIQSILEQPTLGVNPTCVRVPVFFGDSIAVHLETESKLAAQQVYALLEAADGLSVIDTSEEGGYPTAVTEGVNEDTVWVGRIREDYSHPFGMNLWLVADNVRKGTALNGVQIAELLIKQL